MRALAFTDNQLAELRQAAAMLAPALRSEFLRMVVGFLEVEGAVTDAAVRRAIAFAVEQAASGASMASR